MYMEFSDITKLPDGRYYVKLSNDVRVIEKNVKIGEIQDDMVVTLSDTSQIQAHDQKIIDAAFENSTQWFQREIVKDVISGYYQSALEDKILQIVPNTTPKGKLAVGMFSDAKDPLDRVDPGTVCTVLLQLDGLWFLKKSFGPVWKLMQVRVKRQAKPIQCLIDDEDSD